MRPYCPDGRRCRFIHPDEEKWALRKPRIKREVAEGPTLPPSALATRISPLVPQSDLFRRSTNRDTEADHHPRQDHSHEPGRAYVRDNDDRNIRGRSFGDRRVHELGSSPLLGKRTRDSEGSNIRDRSIRSDSRDVYTGENTRKSPMRLNSDKEGTMFTPRVTEGGRRNASMFHGRPREGGVGAGPGDARSARNANSGRVDAALRGIARASTDITMISIKLQASAQKLDAFREVQRSLSVMTANAPVSVSHLIQHLKEEHKCLKMDAARAEVRLQILWEDVCSEIGRFVQDMVKDRTGRIQEEANQTIAMESRHADDERERKRSRILDPEDYRQTQTADTQGIEDRSTVLEARVNRHGEMIAFLLKENEELKAKLKMPTTQAWAEPQSHSPDILTASSSGQDRSRRDSESFLYDSSNVSMGNNIERLLERLRAGYAPHAK